jgi:CRP/FNR family transcriptional regulator, polysaccharide utilization system transcription regulator
LQIKVGNFVLNFRIQARMENGSVVLKSLSGFHGFVSLNDGEKEYIKKHSNIVSYYDGDVIFKQNTRTSHIMFIKEGLVKIYKEGRNDKRIILKLAKSGFFIGLLSDFGDDIHRYNASSVGNSEIIFIDIGAFQDVVRENGAFALHLLNQVSLDGLYIFEKLMSQYHKQLPGRIADVLLFFSEIIFQSHVFSFPLTRRELAEFAGTTKESFIRTLTEFKNDRIINLEGKDVEIISMDIIKTLSRLG